MISHAAAHLALRNRALSLVVATTGATSLSATATGYHRAAGSFLAEGFYNGMEITPAGFAANPVDIVTGVTASDIATKNPRGVEAEAAARTIGVGLPILRAFENVPFTPIAGRPYVIEEYSPSTARLLSSPAAGGELEETGDYVLTWCGVIAAGSIPGVGISAIRKSVDALRLLFAPGTKLAAGAHFVRMRTDIAPQTGQIIPLDGWAALQLKVPWEAYSTNSIAA